MYRVLKKASRLCMCTFLLLGDATVCTCIALWHAV